ncbi:hypothetical protein BDY21DRAFT_115277 [Lineolata rhizophorae]|uniref:Uncharacterized protein n=1 Tax=Lineolata rhizophorae TaxID=578093 RepID=A0A6A6NRA5_9PEZI|nr:hypothetical protein BDY21DRAFT_115277 [Lineolata rhizophorae]
MMSQVAIPAATVQMSALPTLQYRYPFLGFGPSSRTKCLACLKRMVFSRLYVGSNRDIYRRSPFLCSFFSLFFLSSSILGSDLSLLLSTPLWLVHNSSQLLRLRHIEYVLHMPFIYFASRSLLSLEAPMAYISRRRKSPLHMHAQESRKQKWPSGKSISFSQRNSENFVREFSTRFAQDRSLHRGQARRSSFELHVTPGSADQCCNRHQSRPQPLLRVRTLGRLQPRRPSFTLSTSNSTLDVLTARCRSFASSHVVAKTTFFEEDLGESCSWSRPWM